MKTKTAINSQIVVKSLEKEALPITRKVSNLKIKNLEHYQLAADLLKKLKEIKKEAKTEEEKFTKPLNELLKTTRTHFKPFFTSIDLIESDTKQRMGVFLEAQEAKQKQLEKKMESGDIKKVSTFVKKSAELEVNSSSASVRRIKKLWIVNEMIIPREFLVPNEAAIFAALKDGKKVAGCKITTVKNIAI
jgi:hypothetical protein